jgi:phage tail sheath protein FI
VQNYRIPGIYYESVFPADRAKLRTAVPVFLAYCGDSYTKITYITNWSEFNSQFGNMPSESHLQEAVHGFFRNDGQVCFIAPMPVMTLEALRKKLDALVTYEGFDLICAPDLTVNSDPAEYLEMQAAILEACDRIGHCFAILDSRPGSDLNLVSEQHQRLLRDAYGKNGALYFPWLKTESGQVCPPCGHMAGIYARSDYRKGIHKAPANELVEGVVDLEKVPDRGEQIRLTDLNVNYIRVVRGRGIRVWGARTLSSDSAWVYISTRRLFLTIKSWIELNLADAAFELNTPSLWSHLTRELTVYLNSLVQLGKLHDFTVKCDTETNPSDAIEIGQVCTQITLVPTIPLEVILIRVMHSEGNITIEQAVSF